VDELAILLQAKGVLMLDPAAETVTVAASVRLH
jgi:hypothetical protein